MSNSNNPAPFVFWGQNSSKIFLRIALRDVQSQPDVGISADEISFKASGSGGHGESVYQFRISTFAQISPEKSKMKVVGSAVMLELPKRDSSENAWPRLTRQQSKVPWLKPDFDKMDVSSDEEETQRLQEDYIKKLTKEIEQTRNDAIEDLKSNYLFCYSLFQVISYSFIAIKVLYGLLISPEYNSYDDIGFTLTVAQIFSFMEVLHPLMGIVKSSWIPPLIQTCGRNMILLVLVRHEPELQATRVFSYLVLCWSAVECVRYPFYMMNSKKVNWAWLTWLRYSVWLPLYPAGAFCEWLLTWYGLPLYRASQRFSIDLPNILNFSFHLHWYWTLHLFLLPIFLYKMMLHMHSLRKKKLVEKKKTD